MKNAKVIVRMRGGLGNQLFCYAAARRLALVNDAELAIDDVTGFVRDREYGRKYALDRFSIPCRKATPRERLEPFERYRRGIAKFLARRRSFSEKTYLEEEGSDFDPRLLVFRVSGTVYIDGLWQDERYFKDAEAVIRRDLEIEPPDDAINRDAAAKIRGCNSIGVHVRWFGRPGDRSGRNIDRSYYSRAVQIINDRVAAPHFFLFSDDPNPARAALPLPEESVTCMNHNSPREAAHVDLWLLNQCSHFIVANSTFSWWGAWLGDSPSKIIIAPEIQPTNTTAWDLRSLIPDGWVRISTGTI